MYTSVYVCKFVDDRETEKGRHIVSVGRLNMVKEGYILKKYYWEKYNCGNYV